MSNLHIGGVGDLSPTTPSRLRPYTDSTQLYRSRDYTALSRRFQEDGYIYIRDVIPRSLVADARLVVANQVQKFWSVLDIPSLQRCEVDVKPSVSLPTSTMSIKTLGDPQATSSAPQTQCPQFPNLVPSSAYHPSLEMSLSGLRSLTDHSSIRAMVEGPHVFHLISALFGEAAVTLTKKWVRVKGPQQFTDAHSDFYRFAAADTLSHRLRIPYNQFCRSLLTSVMCQRQEQVHEGSLSSANGDNVIGCSRHDHRRGDVDLSWSDVSWSNHSTKTPTNPIPLWLRGGLWSSTCLSSSSTLPLTSPSLSSQTSPSSSCSPSTSVSNSSSLTPPPTQNTIADLGVLQTAALGLVTCWSPLSDVNITDGVLAILKGSHHLRTRHIDPVSTNLTDCRSVSCSHSERAMKMRADHDASRTHEDGARCADEKEATMSHESESTQVVTKEEKSSGNNDELPIGYKQFEREGEWHVGECRAGDVILFDVRLVHASTKTTSNIIRLSIDSRWRPISSLSAINNQADVEMYASTPYMPP